MWRMRFGIRSAAPVRAIPPKLCDTRMTSLRSSHSKTLTRSCTKMASVTFFEVRCERSPKPVCVGVYTRWPAVRNGSATRLQHQPPCQAPCCRTNVFVLPGVVLTPLAQQTDATPAIAATVPAKKVRLSVINAPYKTIRASQADCVRPSPGRIGLLLLSRRSQHKSVPGRPPPGEGAEDRHAAPRTHLQRR